MGNLSSIEIPEIDPVALSFLNAVEKSNFSGEAKSDLGNRVACSTDNSIYQILPQAVIYPKVGEDLIILMQIAQQCEFQELKFYPRGGGTSTNGQSLGAGIIVDTSRYMCRILDHDTENGLVRVEPGLIRDKLNDFLKPHGRFFAPHVSTTNRATLGGMVSNDSSGKGSVVYGKTSDHIHSIEFVTTSGDVLDIENTTAKDVPKLDGALGKLTQEIDNILAPHFEEIQTRFPELKRGFTGYNLKEARAKNGDLNLKKLVAGSEGTLGFIKSITLKAEPIPAHTLLAVLVYSNHDSGLRAVSGLLKSKPHAIEFIDDKLLGAALHSPFADDVKNVLGINQSNSAFSAHFLELSDEDDDNLTRRLDKLLAQLKTIPKELRPIGVKVLRQADQIARVWEIRRACQGLLAGFDRNKRAVAFIEDCAVPPESLADFVADLEAVLQSKKIPLGMYGHADVGCVHIRPLMNLTAEDERRQIREITDAVFELTQKHGGLLWGEHGKGLRGEYSEKVIGPNLFEVMQKVKGAFDPSNRMNPGKVARPLNDTEPLIKLDSVHMRGEFDEQVSPELSKTFANILRCDGNGACFNKDDSSSFCPSYKATGDRRLSPKGRAGMLRTWARSRSLGREQEAQTIAVELKDILDTCLACKACAGAGCPAAVDIPQMKSQFLDWYYKAAKRPSTDLLVANLERLAPKIDFLGSSLFNRLQSLSPIKALISNWFGLVDLPKMRNKRAYNKRLQHLGVKTMAVKDLLQIQKAEREQMVVIVQDCFTSFYDSDVLLAQIELVQKLGFTPVLLSYREGGKPLHVRGYSDRFQNIAKLNANDLAALSDAQFTLLGVDGSTTLMYRHEYQETVPDCPEFSVLMLSEWLNKITLPSLKSENNYTLIQHCTERSITPETTNQWADIFKAANIDVKITSVGCCGMSGLFGHEVTHQHISTNLYDQNWRNIVEETQETLIATGYSCRSQVKRFSDLKPLHPAQVLLKHWDG